MTRELKRITAIRGLKCCIESDENVFCPDDCPYSDTFGDNSCEANLHKDLLEMIKPRLLTAEELEHWDRPVWLETPEYGSYMLIHNVLRKYVEFICSKCVSYHVWHFQGYGSEWRCWTDQPIPGQSEAHPWKEWPE